MTQDCPENPQCPPRRHAAGEDPQKRRQILEGAWHEFTTHGFDATTMNGICRRAGVSKGTLYVYFRDKEDLFVALVEDRRIAFLAEMSTAMSAPVAIDVRLASYARTLIRRLTSDEMVRAFRSVIAVADRMPDLSRRFYDAGARFALHRLAEWLIEAERAGQLQMSDPDRAAMQFSELAMGGIWRQRLFGIRRSPPDEAEIAETADEAVRVFMAAYGIAQ